MKTFEDSASQSRHLQGFEAYQSFAPASVPTDCEQVHGQQTSETLPQSAITDQA